MKPINTTAGTAERFATQEEATRRMQDLRGLGIACKVTFRSFRTRNFGNRNWWYVVFTGGDQ